MSIFSWPKAKKHELHAKTVKTNIATQTAKPTGATKVHAHVFNSQLKFDGTPIEVDKDLGRVFIRKQLSGELNLVASVQAQICPVQTDDSPKNCILLVTSGYQNAPEILEVVSLMRQKGYELRQGTNAYIISVQLLLSLSRGDITTESINARRRVNSDPKQSRLWTGFKDIINWAHERGAADVHFCIKTAESTSQVRFTIEGKYVEPERFRIPTATLLDQLGLAWQHSNGGNGSGFNAQEEQDCQIFVDLPSGKRVMLRWSSMAADQGPSVTLRILDLDVELKTQSLASLGYLPAHVAAMTRAMHSEGGAVILSGVMASGKSTTLATVAGGLPRTKKVITLEAPVEYIIPNAIQNTVVSGTAQLTNKLKAIKRSGGHAFLLGEIRDQETGMAYQDLTEAGLDLMTTVHAGRAIYIPNRLSSPFIGVSRDVLATPGNMKLLVSQALLPVNCAGCKLPAKSLFDPAWFDSETERAKNSAYLARIERLYNIDIESINVRNPNGCDVCRREGLEPLNGLKGRTVVAEMFEPDDYYLSQIKAANYIEVDRYYESLRTADFASEEMLGKSAMECAVYKMSTGLIDPREIEPRFMSFETVELRRTLRKPNTPENA
jgi:general secretion pathway protein E